MAYLEQRRERELERERERERERQLEEEEAGEKRVSPVRNPCKQLCPFATLRQ